MVLSFLVVLSGGVGDDISVGFGVVVLIFLVIFLMVMLLIFLVVVMVLRDISGDTVLLVLRRTTDLSDGGG